MKSFIFALALAFAAAGLPGTAATAEQDWIQQGKALRQQAEQGDSAAMLQLAFLLQKHAPAPKRPMKMCDGKLVNPLIKTKDQKNCVLVKDQANEARLKAWKDIGSKWTVMSWIKKSAEHGNQKAIAILCKLGQDQAAPAETRAEGGKWCAAAR